MTATAHSRAIAHLVDDACAGTLPPGMPAPELLFNPPTPMQFDSAARQARHLAAEIGALREALHCVDAGEPGTVVHGRIDSLLQDRTQALVALYAGVLEEGRAAADAVPVGGQWP